uniref:NADP oxidoreductase n=1 Tax=uncultured Dehalococcoidia bacterium TaxID=498747 RepID=A0A871Y6V3_9CHLR|nr:NADP oxidoreductase [uncultured Dehalococcoidia bacterium]
MIGGCYGITNLLPPNSSIGESVKRHRIAVTWLDCCTICQMAFLDLDEVLVGFGGAVQVVASPITDIRKFEHSDITIVQGAIGSPQDEDALRHIREKCGSLLAWGNCACYGGLCSMHNLATFRHMLTPPPDPTDPEDMEIGNPLTQPLPEQGNILTDIVTVDYLIPGCPPTASVIRHALTEIFAGRNPIPDTLPEYPGFPEYPTPEPY